MEHSVETEEKYQMVESKKAAILEQLRQRGCRITRQREVLLDVILEGGCTCCKEIYFHAMKKDPHIGMATIYRMVNLLEEIGALRWRNEYQVCAADEPGMKNCQVELDDATQIELEPEVFRQVLEKGMDVQGYLNGQKVKRIIIDKISH